MMDCGEDVDMIVFKMGECEKIFFQKFGMDIGIKKVLFCEVVEKIMVWKLNFEGFEDFRERFFLDQYKKRKEERCIVEEKVKVEKKEKDKEKLFRNELKQQNGMSQLELVVEEGFFVLDLNLNELYVLGSIRKSSVFNDFSSYVMIDC